MDWTIVAILVGAAASHAASAAAWIVIGGLGGQWRINRILVKQLDDIQRIDDRITREVKQRAGREGQEARQATKSIEQQAAEHLAVAPVPSGPPSTLGMINGGR